MRKGVGAIFGRQLDKLAIYTETPGMVIRNGPGRREDKK
jgi:hypothetical protein